MGLKLVQCGYFDAVWRQCNGEVQLSAVIFVRSRGSGALVESGFK